MVIMQNGILSDTRDDGDAHIYMGSELIYMNGTISTSFDFEST